VSSNRDASSIRLIHTIPLLVAGFVLTSSSTNLVGVGVFQDLLFASGILLWIVGVLGSVYWVANRFAGAHTARWAVGILLLGLVIDLMFGQRDD